VVNDRKREDGVRELLEHDLFEVSLTPSPANRDTRVLSMKGAHREDDDGAEAAVEREFQNFRSVFADVLGPLPQRDHNRRFATKLAKEIDPSLVGTVHDPTVCVDARPPTTVETKALERARTRAERRAMPIQIKTFEV
jgi:hypothetical protein